MSEQNDTPFQNVRRLILPGIESEAVRISAGSRIFEGWLALPPSVAGVVAFTQSTTPGPAVRIERTMMMMLHAVGVGTLQLRGDSHATAAGVAWLKRQHSQYRLGCFGIFDSSAAAVRAASDPSLGLESLLCIGGPFGVAPEEFEKVQTPTLLVTGSDDAAMFSEAKAALERVGSTRRMLEIIPGAEPKFTEPGSGEAAAHLAADWFEACFHHASELALRKVFI